MLLFFQTSVLLAISTLGTPGPVDRVLDAGAVEPFDDSSNLYAMDPTYGAQCLTCTCGQDCPPSDCGCDKQPQPVTPPTLPNTATAPDQHCTGATGELCPFKCNADGTCYCYNFCSKNTCRVKTPDGTVVEMEGRCDRNLAIICLRYCDAYCDQIARDVQLSQSTTATVTAPYCRKLQKKQAILGGSDIQVADVFGVSGTDFQDSVRTPFFDTGVGNIFPDYDSL